MSEPATTQAPPPADTPPVEGGEEGPSKKALKKAEAKAKKEAEKARRAAERAAASAQTAAVETEDLAKDNYGKETEYPEGTEITLKNLGEEHVGKTVVLRAWLQNVRPQSAKMIFLELREEGSWSIQAIAAANPEGAPVSRQMTKWVSGLNPESFLVVAGTVVKPAVPINSCKVSNYELHLTKVYLRAAAPANLGMTLAASNRPVTNFSDEAPAAVEEGVAKLSIAASGEASAIPAASMGVHLDNIVMHKRSPLQQAIADVRMEVRELFSSYLKERGFKLFEAPALIGASSEGGSEVFKMPYFGGEAYLAQSPQFYKQMEIAGGRKRVYCIGPVFRAEKSQTPRHLTEFTGLDLEMEIQKDYHEVIDMLEQTLLYIFRGLKERCAEQIEVVRSVYPSEDFLLPEPGKEVRLTFAEGQKLLREEGPEEYRNVSDNEDMSTPQEKALGQLIKKKYGVDFYLLDKFPSDARPFYAKEDPTNPNVTNAMDLFMRGNEIVSGGQRINDPAELRARMIKKGVDPNSPGLKEYAEVFELGVPPHGGGGIGLDRVVALYLNLPSVQLSAYYPRTPKRLLP